MLDFSSIPPHIQVAIAEKIDYFDRREFELSSKYGKDVLSFTHSESVVEVSRIDTFKDIFNDNLGMFLITEKGKVWKTCSQLCECSYLPRFQVSKVEIDSNVSLDSLVELWERQLIVSNDVYLTWNRMESALPVFSSLSLLLELFNVTSLILEANGPIEETLFSTTNFCEIPRILFTSAEIPDGNLLKLRGTVIRLLNQHANRISTTANRFFKQWFSTKRSIEWLEIQTDVNEEWRGAIKGEILFSVLPYSVIWKFNEDQKDKKLIFMDMRDSNPSSSECKETWALEKHSMIYSIDRGDKKLLVFASTYEIMPSCEYEFIKAQEYTELGEIIRIDDVNLS